MLKFSTSGQKAEESSNSKLPHPTPPSGFQSALSVPMHTQTHTCTPAGIVSRKIFSFPFQTWCCFQNTSGNNLFTDCIFDFFGLLQMGFSLFWGAEMSSFIK